MGLFIMSQRGHPGSGPLHRSVDWGRGEGMTSVWWDRMVAISVMGRAPEGIQMTLPWITERIVDHFDWREFTATP